MNIYAKLLADSINQEGNRLTTFEIQLPKCLLAEILTHRDISRNFQSSRAVPTTAMNEIESFEPIYYGKNQPGMMASKDEIEYRNEAAHNWQCAIEYCKDIAANLSKLGLHKQWANRPNDWHVMAKGVVSATEWKNFLWLRHHQAAQPEFQELARLISEALDSNQPEFLQPGEWHLPYIDKKKSTLSLEDQIKVSASCCAQVSYRKHDESVEKALDIYQKLVGMSRLHASPFEHQATPIPKTLDGMKWDKGVSHMDRNGKLWSGNFQGWIQLRKTMANEVKR